jgi:hypothetical protein
MNAIPDILRKSHLASFLLLQISYMMQGTYVVFLGKGGCDNPE